MHRYDGNKLLAIAMMLAGVSTAGIPVVSHVALLGALTSTQGICMGMLDTVTTVWFLLSQFNDG
jgi:Na+/H+-dicarboxylate symporter